MKYKILSVSIIFILLMCPVAINSAEIMTSPGKFESNVRLFNSWRVLTVREGNIKYVAIETLPEPYTLFRIVILKNKNPELWLITKNNGPFNPGAQAALQSIFMIGNKRYDFTLMLQDRGPFIFGFLDGLPKNILSIMNNSNSFAIDMTNQPVRINLLGFKEALNYAYTLLKKI